MFKHLLLIFFLATAGPVLILRWVDPPTSLFMIHARVSALFRGDFNFDPKYRWVDWAQISPQAKVAVIAAEDQHFADHFGFDFKALRKAYERNQRGKSIRGGSTITQQTAKNLFLYPGRNYLRKGLEAWFSLLIELSWPKQRILEIYLNIAEFGHGLYGIEMASQTFFNRPAARLSTDQAALLAAVLPNPKLLKANHPSPYLRKRQSWIVKQIRNLGGSNFLKRL